MKKTVNCLEIGGAVFLFSNDLIRLFHEYGIIVERFTLSYFGSGDQLSVPRIEWGCGMAHKTIRGGLCPGGRLRMERLIDLVRYGHLDLSRLVTHVFNGLEHIEEALLLMKDKPKDLIKPVVLVK